MTEEEIRKQWHEFFIANKHRFTSSRREAQEDKDKIYVSKEHSVWKTNTDPTLRENINYHGWWEEN